MVALTSEAEAEALVGVRLLLGLRDISSDATPADVPGLARSAAAGDVGVAGVLLFALPEGFPAAAGLPQAAQPWGTARA